MKTETKIRLSNKQVNDIARIWAANILHACDLTSFDDTISDTDKDRILENVNAIANNISNNRPNIYTIYDIIKFVINKNQK